MEVFAATAAYVIQFFCVGKAGADGSRYQVCGGPGRLRWEYDSLVTHFPSLSVVKYHYDCLGKGPKYVVMLGLVIDSSDVETEKKAVEESPELESGSDQRSIFVEGQRQ